MVAVQIILILLLLPPAFETSRVINPKNPKNIQKKYFS